MTPPFPPRHEGRLPPLELLRRGARSFISIWNTAAFGAPVIDTRILGRRIVVLNDPALISAAFVEGHAAFERKSPQMRHALEPLLGDGLFISDGLVWKRRRPQVQRVTHPSRLAELVPVMTQVAEEWAGDWARRPDGAVLDALAEMGRFAAEVISRTLFGAALGRQAAGQVVAAFAEYQAVVGNTDLLSLLNLPDFLPRWHGFRARGAARRIQAVVDGLIGRILAGEGESSLIAAMAEGGGMDRRGFRNEAITLFMAGHETTANCLAWCWFLLGEDAEAEAAVAEESQRVLAGRAAGFADIPHLPWARAVVEEALRLYPPVPLLAREVQAPVALGELALEAGTIAVVSPWLVHRHRALWEAPDEFRPQRFLPGAPPPARMTFLPFSLGPRVCTGQHFGLYEAIIALSSLAGRFRLRPVPGHRAFPVARLTLRPGESLPMRLERRA
ncbi:cytochrome P450 [Roseococcus sp. DSY-14]|uniref:cytochrome P450 n=1 Tax=Roseococcus sp. DSY-14 TaxID=3369650 RepID=UPI00387B8DFF